MNANQNDFRLPLIFDIRRGSMDDGPGIRTVVFFKGCHLRCVWCHNPESMSPFAQIAVYPGQCVSCRQCQNTCPAQAISYNPGMSISREKCIVCGRCSDVCPACAIKKIGKYYPDHLLLELCLLDEPFYKTSDGGVTFSGGEPTLHMDYLGLILRKLKNKGIHTAIQTCGYFDFPRFKKTVLPYLDMVFFDVKFIDQNLHRKFTGKDNRLILDNLTCLSKKVSIPVITRTPLIPGITDTSENLNSIVEFTGRLGLHNHKLLPYNTGSKMVGGAGTADQCHKA